VNDQLLVQPQAVLLSMVRALHVIRGVLQEVGGRDYTILLRYAMLDQAFISRALG
jgi:hypothetical protein